MQRAHGLRRSLGTQISTLPRKPDTVDALALTPYDVTPWDTSSSGFRNRVHVWVGGDMLPSSSPNDPVFYLNHCNVDRIWEAWLTQHGRKYRPLQSAPAFLKGHRINDLMSSLLSAPMRPADVLDMTSIYVYDSLAV